MIRPALLALGLACLAGCATGPEAVSTLPWRDAAFAHDPRLVTVTREELFRLDPQLEATLREAAATPMGPSQRLRHLLATVFGAEKRRFTYAAGRSTTAAETWRTQRGDCLSLTVLTYSVAREMGMDALMQEVPTPALFDRRGEFDFVNQHVNVLFRRAHRNITEDAHPRDVVVDFEPDFASPRPGRALTEAGIYARFLNNKATEYLASGDREGAYAHFRAAIAADPGYAASYGNLALLYRKASLHVEAEQLLRHAVALSNEADVPLNALHGLLAEQGRDGEARRYESLLHTRRTRDPYHWIGMGLQHLQAGDPRRAISALETARGMTGNFREVHAFLAIAYWRAGDSSRAHEELAVLSSLGASETGVAKLRRKFGSPVR